ncbi:hypothetical protein P7K49_012225, partial [Saguinus oedipus]
MFSKPSKSQAAELFGSKLSHCQAGDAGLKLPGGTAKSRPRKATPPQALGEGPPRHTSSGSALA